MSQRHCCNTWQINVLCASGLLTLTFKILQRHSPFSNSPLALVTYLRSIDSMVRDKMARDCRRSLFSRPVTYLNFLPVEQCSKPDDSCPPPFSSFSSAMCDGTFAELPGTIHRCVLCASSESYHGFEMFRVYTNVTLKCYTSVSVELPRSDWQSLRPRDLPWHFRDCGFSFRQGIAVGDFGSFGLGGFWPLLSCQRVL